MNGAICLIFVIDMDGKVLIHTLPSGLRAVTASAGGNVCYSGVLTGIGSRDDGAGKDGLAHFVEHTIFKGTSRRSSGRVSNRMELIGGELNAYTTKENILIYTTAPSGYERRGLELLADLVWNARFDADELDLERGVVLEEINSYHDNPSYAVYDEFDELFFAGNALGHNILGYADTVRNLAREDAVGFLNAGFTPGNMVVYCVAPGDPARSMRMIEKYFAEAGRPEFISGRVTPAQAGPFDEMRDRGNRQANVLMGTQACTVTDNDRFAFFLLSNMLGGPAMNSRLNSTLRERRGLVYNVETSLSLFSDTGVFQIFFGCDPHNVEKCSRIAVREIEKLAEKELSEAAFRRATRQICGQLLVSGDNRESYAMMLAKSLMRFGKVLDTRHTADMISALTPEDLRKAAARVADSKLSRLVLV